LLPVQYRAGEDNVRFSLAIVNNYFIGTNPNVVWAVLSRRGRWRGLQIAHGKALQILGFWGFVGNIVIVFCWI
jgi:hypothetical protein